jgi:potassium/chloride transporter 9
MIPEANHLIRNGSDVVYRNYTGFQFETLEENWNQHYGRDYSSDGRDVDFATVFGVLFSGVTGIMAGANMSGD